jgi:CubicO group peptidase (beta-lactamase class C family)
MTNDPASAGMSASALHAMTEFFARTYVQTGKLSGVAMLVERRGVPALCAAMGKADIAGDKPLELDTIFRIYSMTKPITCVAFLMLVERGLVALGDPVSDYIPEWRDLQVARNSGNPAPPAQPMRIIDLLRHTSGLTYDFQNRTIGDAEYRRLGIRAQGGRLTPDEMLSAIGAVPLDFEPGTAWNYSISTDIIGYLIARISGVRLDRFLQDEIFDPLGMVDTSFYVDAKKASRLATCYERTAEKILRPVSEEANRAFLSPPPAPSGGGGLLSTLADYRAFCSMLLNGGTVRDVRIIGRKTVAMMASNHLPRGADLASLSRSLFNEAHYAGIGYGLGVGVTLDPVAGLNAGTAGDYFWGGKASTFFWIDPAEQMIAILMTQLLPSTAYPLRNQFRTMTYAAIG